jgi:hypothetical protein
MYPAAKSETVLKFFKQNELAMKVEARMAAGAVI